MIDRHCSVCTRNALIIAISAFALISLFWAVILTAALSQSPAVFTAAPNGFLGNLLAWWEYWYGFVGAVFGGVIGYFVALWQDHQKAKREASLVLSGVDENLRYNIQLIDQAISQLRLKEFPNYPLDYEGLSLWTARAHGLFPKEFTQALTGLRFQYWHLTKKMADLSADPEKERVEEVCDHLQEAKVWTLERRVEIQALQR